MRPLTLRMSGLRSFRSEVTVDFGDPGLIAIVGDTGAGKSSILEALFFVLYGGCTWDYRATAPLISDGASLMQVELVFTAEGRRWRVFRSASRTATQSRHELECLDDRALRFDNDGPVTAEVKRLLGLDQTAFLRTVILPQGQFQLLLQATRGERTAILKGIFRLGQLAEARDRADRSTRRLRPKVENLRVERAGLLPDPEAALADARARHKQARSRQAHLQGLSEKITAASRQRDEADRQLSDLQERIRLVRESIMPGAEAKLAQLSGIASQLEDRRAQLETERAKNRKDAESLAEILSRADRQGAGIEALAGAAATLQSLAEQLPGLHAEEAACQQEAGEIRERSARVASDEADATALQAQASAARAEEARLEQSANATSEILTDARTRLTAARNAASVYSERQRERRDAADRKSEAAAAIEPAAAHASATAEQLQAANTALEGVQRAHAAAHAAEGRQPGDPCPVCQRPLPADFTMPRPPGEAETRAKLENAQREAEQASRGLATVQAELRSASGELERADKAARDAEATLTEALSELQQVLSNADLSIDDDVLLARLTTDSRVAMETHREQAEKADNLTRQAERAADKVEELRREVSRRSEQLVTRQGAIRERKESCEKAAIELPAGYRVEAPLTADKLGAASERVQLRRNELTDVSKRLTDVRMKIDQIGGDLETLSQQVRAEVDDPARQLVLLLSNAGQRLSDLTAAIGTPPPPARSGGGLAADAEWAHDLKEATDTALNRAQATITALQQQRTEALSAISGALAAAEMGDEAGLQQAIIDASADLNRAADDIQKATEQIPRAADLARKIEQGQGLVDALDELTRLLSDANFTAYVVARKQQTLLAIATELLGSMTGNRYGFSHAFEIVDRLTGLPRSVKTLSGGETFLASLALALGLVELAGRGGGRLEALFLDEGFGSLDANSLSEALDALGRQAETGRMVAVISHLRSIAEAMDRVLAVTAGPTGSQVRWLGGDERDQLVTQDIEASLLT